jgi:hypothetical protein
VTPQMIRIRHVAVLKKPLRESFGSSSNGYLTTGLPLGRSFTAT